MPSSISVTSQYIRCARVVIEQAEGQTIDIENKDGRGIRIVFSVERSFDPDENKPQFAEIRLYNLSADTRFVIEGLKGIRAPVPATWSKAQLLASDAERNYAGPDAIAAPVDPKPGLELPADPVKSSHKFGYAYVRLFAGYNRKMGQIFEGSVIVPRSAKVDPLTWETRLVVGDGALGQTKAIANTSFPPGTEMIVVLRHLVRLLGVGTGNLSDTEFKRILAAGQQQAQKPFATSSRLAWSYNPSGASAWDDLAELLELSSVKWIIDGGNFYLLEPDGHMPSPPVDMGRPIGAVRQLGGGLFSGTFFLNQNARPAGKVTLDSKQYKGEYVARRVAYAGDTHGGGFNTIVDFAVNDPLNLGLDLEGL